ncbi:hypothetical protein DTO013E5_5994 [Penicillium roqueforti]|uniref:uncharacterized protein n=1 Tax=Penicillium roqueforti TaxID=5082 RepID=UPI001909B8A4|nr:uncharacterized protein LCP9604111_5424 [Penicillium roqueforti]KAF9248169.1 hypothetical protein LCP9604111_5424 [Penicillium roqueforti]KAI1836026.1 hypothetical protein CBS147337_3175 [Penicillium roqueforti]KAI2676876.1 hypothetical protein LCP963914a_8171 [Penicillium roqueforti]KAI2683048.1 hypothetical protein CBS147355_2188 [Penicillium roqueforti]KAI2701616.1 hypothetical protein CBS147372_4669 [Penicillium roqueforti]
MSEQPPSYGGHSSYAQQWPPAYPSMIPANFPSSEYPQMHQPTATNHGPTFDYNMASVNANSRVPGSNGAGNLAFIPPQFPFFNHFDASQFPPHFPPMPFPPMSYPPMPTGSSHPPMPYHGIDGNVTHQLSTPAVHPKTAQVQPDNHREEGEVSEGSDERSLHPTTRKATRQYSDLEEGETISSSAQSVRSSQSPYDPPLSVSADPSLVHRAMQPQRQDPPATVPAPPPQKSAAQLRIQAQGALLSLAPHNIRYNELVAEGINPMILKRLYEEVGIKVTTSSGQSPPVPEKASAVAAVASKGLGTRKPAEVPLPAPQPSAPPVAPPAKAGKPLERKELIARMLAEKAAKVTSKEASPTGSAKSHPAIQVDEPRPVPKETLVKEKSKAQTELARQRIEELKKQTLLKTQKLAQANLPPIQLESPAPAIQHPLPLRPPVPESRRSAGLPGLLMTGLEQEPHETLAAEPVQPINIDSTPVSQATQRKRPLASDFDEPVAPTKKHFNHAANRFDPTDKLIIAISDDESLYGDDEDDDMELDSSSEQEQAPIVTSALVKPTIQLNPPVTRASTATPQAPSSLSDQGDIRLKDMEIQAMRRKIAELELRRKSKLAASRAQSPRTLDDSGASSSSGQSSGQSSGVAASSEEDSSKTKPTTAAPDMIMPVAPLAQLDALSEAAANREPLEEAFAEEVANGVIDSAAQTSASFESDSARSAMQESDDSSSDISDSSSESEDEPTTSPAQLDVDPATVPSFSEPMEIDSSERSVSQSSPSAITHPSANSADEHVSQNQLSEQSQRELSADSDGYEPPEPDADAQSEGSSYSPPPFSPAISGLVENTGVSAPSFDLAQADEKLTSTPQVSDSLRRSDLQVGASGTETSSAISEQRFTPYTSPLRTFKAYRYHPHYAADVPSGYRSLTYSHNIDSMKYMCPYELAGGVCNDRSCEFQHLRDMTLSDDKILVQMGSVREGQTEEEKEKYLAGLKEIINDLRRDKVKDFNTVASEIAAYRRRFLQDPSRVLSL